MSKSFDSLCLVQDMEVERRICAFDELLEVSVHFLGGFRAEDHTQHFREHDELVWVVG